MSGQSGAGLRQQEDIPGRAFSAGALQWLVDRDLGAEHLMAYRLTVNPDSTASHAHSGTEEVLYVLEGCGEIRIEDASYFVSPGHALFVREGVEHSYINAGDRPLIVVGAMAPAIDTASIPMAGARLGLRGPVNPGLAEYGPGRIMDERQVTPTMMGERSFQLLMSPAVGCRRMTQFTGLIPTGRAPLHAHPHEEVVYVVSGSGRLWIEEDPLGELRPGAVVFIPIAVRHTLENSGHEPMKVLGIFSPAGSPAATVRPTS